MSPCEQLNSTEVRVATLVWQGHTNPEIAARFGTSEQVIKNHLRSIFDKLGVWSRLELAIYVASHGGAVWEPSAIKEHSHASAIMETAAVVSERGAQP